MLFIMNIPESAEVTKKKQSTLLTKSTFLPQYRIHRFIKQIQ